MFNKAGCTANRRQVNCEAKPQNLAPVIKASHVPTHIGYSLSLEVINVSLFPKLLQVTLAQRGQHWVACHVYNNTVLL